MKYVFIVYFVWYDILRLPKFAIQWGRKEIDRASLFVFVYTKSMPLSALIIGTGIVGKRHALAQKKLGSKVGVFDKSFQKASLFATQHGLSAFDNLDEAIAWSEVVHICTPDHMHIEVAKKAIRAQKVVLCEKPLTDNLKDAYELERYVNKYDAKFVIANNYRLTSTFSEIRKKLQNRKDQILCLQSTYLHNMVEYVRKTPWREKQKFLYGGAIHPIDLVTWIAAEPVVAVQAQEGKIERAKETKEQDFHITLTFLSGLTAHIWANANIILPKNKTDLKVFTSTASYITDNKSGEIKWYSKFSPVKKFSTETVGVNKTIDDEIVILNKWIFGKRKNHEPLPDIHQAVEVIRVVDAIEQSIKKQKTIEIKRRRGKKIFW